VRELRGLVQRSELRGLAADLRPTVPALAQLNKATIPLLGQVRAASSCQNEVILPWSLDKIDDPDFPAIGPVYQEQPKPLIGLAGESRTFDANGQWFRVALNGSQYATPAGSNRFLLSDKPILGANPPKPAKRSSLRPDIACETQEPPDLRTNPRGSVPASFKVQDPPPEAEAKARARAIEWLQRELRSQGDRKTKVVEDLLTLPELEKIRVPGAGRR
jgi:phospholipid/cholesterol/gamma-HCH transport system substrate-binding protein